MEPRISKGKTIALLLAILALGGWLRLDGVLDRGPYISDEADYVSEARFLVTGAHALAESLRIKARENREGVDIWTYDEQADRIAEGTEGLALKYGRPGHVLLIALAMEILEPDDSAGAVVSALFGTASILVLFLLGRALYSTRVGLIAALLFAVSGYHVWFSRALFAEANTVFFLLVSLLFYVRSRRDSAVSGLVPVALAGLFCGLGFVVHHRLYVLLLFLWAFEAHLWLAERDRPSETKINRALYLNLSVAVPIILMEIPYYLAAVVLRNFGEALPFQTYLEQVVKMIGFQAGYLAIFRSLWSWSNVATYPYLFFKMDGLIPLVLMATGLVTLLRRRSRADLMVLALLLVPLAYYTMTMPVLRYGVVVLPFACLAAANSVLFTGPASLDSRRGRLAWIAIAAVAVLVAGSIKSREISDVHAGYREAMETLGNRGDLKHISNYVHPCRVYAGFENTEPFPTSWEAFHDLRQRGFNTWVSVGFVRFFEPYLAELKEIYQAETAAIEDAAEIEGAVETGLTPIASVDNPFGGSLQNLFEVNYRFADTLAYVRDAKKNKAGLIEIYDIRPLVEKAAGERDPRGKESPE